MKRYVYSESRHMDPIRVIHTNEPGHGWSFESPDLPDMIGGADTYKESHKLAEEAVRFTLDCRAEEQGTETPAQIEIRHYVPEQAAPAAA